MITLKQIQNSPRATRKKWFLLLTVVAAIVLIFLWIQYVSWTFGAATAQPQNGELHEGFNPVQSVRGIFGGIYDSIDASRPANRNRTK